ncbi:MAG TPA: DUF2809 domain-containing protein [Anaerolineales bacterium]|nr:DUF2809 domain-containing protein [Anaerolineales bacterium]
MRLHRTHLLLFIFLLAAEILIATVFARGGFIRHFFGDALVTMLLYHLVKAFYPARPLPLALAVFVFACWVEVLQYFHLADALGLAPGSLGSIILGTSFSWIDILMYLLGCAASYLLDVCLLEKTAPG